MNPDDLAYPLGRSLRYLRTTRSVVCGLLQRGLYSETDDAGIATPRPLRLGLQSPHAYVVVVAIAVGSERLAVR